ncbi:hypothetical protein NDU88_003710 [Pleurodeles waltl]|uniref:protein-tyrosine-phosphatase n=1 Tax=Pleurodeles waltl TaxID=8319 RepID=A0AAV7TRD8_PLEWA|nr:hypothetical protein NDU88_003710 [Pleurodeles waltl]
MGQAGSLKREASGNDKRDRKTHYGGRELQQETVGVVRSTSEREGVEKGRRKRQSGKDEDYRESGGKEANSPPVRLGVHWELQGWEDTGRSAKNTLKRQSEEMHYKAERSLLGMQPKRQFFLGLRKMESTEKLGKESPCLKNLEKKLITKKNGVTGIIAKHHQKTQTMPSSLPLPGPAPLSQHCTGSCPDLMMSRNEIADLRPSSTPQLQRPHRPLCLSLSSEPRLRSQDWRKNLQSQMEQAHSSGAANSTGSLERASLFCATGSSTASSPIELASKAKTSSRFSLFSPPSWNGSFEQDSIPPSRTGSKTFLGYSRKGHPKPEEMEDPGYRPEHFQFSEPIIGRVTDCIYLGNMNAAYSGRALCLHGIDSIIDMSSLPGNHSPSVVPCTCSRGGRHTWSRLKVAIQGPPESECAALRVRGFGDVNDCLEASAEKKKRVLVHCRDGYSLAPTCVIQYLMVRRSMRLLAAYEMVRARFPVNIRQYHQELLVSLEQSLWPGETDPDSFKGVLSRKTAWT